MPAAAVIPAPIAYIKVVAVKKLVVGFSVGDNWSAYWVSICVSLACSWMALLHLTVWCDLQGCYFEEIRVLPAGKCFEYISME